MISDCQGSNSSESPLMRRETLETFPPFSGEVICCLAGIPAESRDSGLGLGLDAEARSAVLSPCQERFHGQCREGVTDSISGLITGDFQIPLSGYRAIQFLVVRVPIAVVQVTLSENDSLFKPVVQIVT